MPLPSSLNPAEWTQVSSDYFHSSAPTTSAGGFDRNKTYFTGDEYWIRTSVMQERVGDQYYDPNTGDLVQIAGPSGMEIPELPPIEEGPAVAEAPQQELWKPPSAPADDSAPGEEEYDGPIPTINWNQLGGGTGTAPSGGSAGGLGETSVEPRPDTTTTTPVRSTPEERDIFTSELTSSPAVDDNITGGIAMGAGLEPSLGSAGKESMARTARGDIDVSELQKRIRTQQAAGGLAYGGAAAKQEARIVGRYKQGKQLRAAAQLADLTGQESELTQRIQQFLATTEANTMEAATTQLLSPIGAYGQLVQGSQAGLAGIFGLGRLL